MSFVFPLGVIHGTLTLGIFVESRGIRINFEEFKG